MEFTNVYIKHTGDESCMPKKMSKGAAAYDVVAAKDTVIFPGRNVVPLGFKMEFPNTWQALIEPRSGFSAKGFEGYRHPDIHHTLALRFDADVIVGKIDSDFRGEVHAIVKSYESQPFRIKKGTRIAQMTFIPIGMIALVEADTLSETERDNDDWDDDEW